MRVLLIDNYDSFTHNLVQALGGLDAALDIRVIRNDACSVDELLAMTPDRLIISPGPCTPRESGVSLDAIAAFRGRVPILGVCLGHQALAMAGGARIVRGPRIVHGKTSLIEHDGRGVFSGLPNPFAAARYHSLVIDPATLPAEYEVTARTADPPHEIMAIRHRDLPIEGVQFHPESFMTLEGPKLLANFLQIGY